MISVFNLRVVMRVFPFIFHWAAAIFETKTRLGIATIRTLLKKKKSYFVRACRALLVFSFLFIPMKNSTGDNNYYGNSLTFYRPSINNDNNLIVFFFCAIMIFCFFDEFKNYEFSKALDN